MKRLGILTAVMAGLLATAAATNAEEIKADLTGNEEVPVVSTVARGEFHGRINPGDESIDYVLFYFGLQGKVTTQAHIHVAQSGVNGGIVFWFCQSTSNRGPAGTPDCTNGSGIFTGTINASSIVAIGGANVGQQIGANQLAKVIDAIRDGNAYANVHTDLSTGGEIRGQIETKNNKNKKDRGNEGRHDH